MLCDVVILTERSDGRMPRRDSARDFERFFALLRMTKTEV